MLAVAIQRIEPENRRQRSGNGKIGTQIDANEKRACDLILDMRALNGAAGDEPGRQIVQEKPASR